MRPPGRRQFENRGVDAAAILFTFDFFDVPEDSRPSKLWNASFASANQFAQLESTSIAKPHSIATIALNVIFTTHPCQNKDLSAENAERTRIKEGSIKSSAMAIRAYSTTDRSPSA